MIPDSLPALAVGTHERGSGFMCVMNAVSYMAGDKIITDFPDCVDPFLARVAQIYNDSGCAHLRHREVVTPNLAPPWAPGDHYQPVAPFDTTRVSELCSKCSHNVWLFGAKLMGTAEPWRGFRPAEREARQWAAWSSVLVRELAALAHHKYAGFWKPAYDGVASYIRRPDQQQEGQLYEVISLLSLPTVYADTLRSVIMLGRTWMNHRLQRATGMFEAHPRGLTGAEPMFDGDAAMRDLASGVARNSLHVRSLTGPGERQVEVAAWADAQLDRWVQATGYHPEGAQLTAERVESIKAEALLTPTGAAV